MPWNEIGPGWLLATWTPQVRGQNPAQYLELVSPGSVHYVLFGLPRNAVVAGWSADGERVPYRYGDHVDVRSLETGTILDSFVTPAPVAAVTDQYSGASFTLPDGLAIYASDDLTLTRYALDGAVEQRFPRTVPGLGHFNGSWLESPDGTQLWEGTARGLAVYSNDGELLQRLTVRNAKSCHPLSWWSSSIVLADCVQTPERYVSYPRLYEFSTAWPKARALMPYDNTPGYLDGYRVGAKIVLQASSYCGPPFVEELKGSKVIWPHIPDQGSGDVVVATTTTELALQTLIGGCGPSHVVVDWWNPDTNAVTQVLGPPYQGGRALSQIGYPSPLSTGSGYGLTIF